MIEVIVGSTQSKPIDQLTNQLQYLSIQQTVASQTPGLAALVSQTSEVHSVQLTNPKGNQQPEGKRKAKGKKGKGSKRLRIMMARVKMTRRR